MSDLKSCARVHVSILCMGQYLRNSRNPLVTEIRILAGTLDRPEIIEKCESADVAQTLVYTSSTPTHTNNNEQVRMVPGINT
jgi:hypothetical protein